MKAVALTMAAALLLAMAMNAEADPKAEVENGVGNLPAYSGPKASVAVAKFEWKAGGEAGVQYEVDGHAYGWTVAQQDYMMGLEDMLTTALVQSNRFRVLERIEFGQIKGEIELSEEGYLEEESQQQRGKVKGADILVIAAITGWDPGSSGIGIGGAGLGAIGGVFGGVNIKKSKMAMDIRLVDSETSEIIRATSVKGEAKDVDFGGIGGGYGGALAMIGGLQVYKNTPMEKAVRACIAEAVKFVASTVPQKYYGE